MTKTTTNICWFFSLQSFSSRNRSSYFFLTTIIAFYDLHSQWSTIRIRHAKLTTKSAMRNRAREETQSGHTLSGWWSSSANIPSKFLDFQSAKDNHSADSECLWWINENLFRIFNLKLLKWPFDIRYCKFQVNFTCRTFQAKSEEQKRKESRNKEHSEQSHRTLF